MRGRRRILAFVLSAAMACSMMPFPAGTVSAEEPSQEQNMEIFTETDTIVPEDIGLPDNEELLDGYVMNILGINSGISTLANYGDQVLNDQEKAIYDQLKKSIAGVAKDGGSTVFQLVGDNSWTFTYEELGWSGWPGTFTDEMSEQLLQKAGITIEKILDTLLVDCPYELYWYDKTAGASIGYSYQGSGTKITFSIPEITFSVAQNYQNSGTENAVDATKAKSAATAVSKAKDIVDKYKDKSDYEKLLGYKNEICDLTSYNDSAADNTNNTPYGDPWQLIYVFDGNKDTTVVCEGYAKAFQYLCDLTTFNDASVVCYTVTGKMDGGPHMWNIVTMPDGQNYLVDVTNSDTNTIGYDGTLFLAGGSGSISNGYEFSNKNETKTKYTYDSDTTSLYGFDTASILNLASEDYDPDALIPLSVQLESSDVAYGTDVVLKVSGASSAGVEVYAGDRKIGGWGLTNGKQDIELNTVKYGFAPIEDSLDETYKNYTLKVQYTGETESEAQEVSFTVDYYKDESNPTAYSPTEQSEDYWYRSDVVLQSPDGYTIADTADAETNWTKEIKVTGEGQIFQNYYLRKLDTDAIVRVQALFSIDKTAPTDLQAGITDQTDTSVKVTASAQDALSGIKSYSLSYVRGGSAAPAVTDQGNGVFAITGMESRTEYQFTLTATDKADNTSTLPVTVSTSGKLSLSGADVTVTGAGSYVYDGTKKEVSANDVTVTLNGTAVPKDEYDVTFSDDLISAGIVTATVTAKANSEDYTGSAQGSFEIAKRDVTITAEDQTITYGETIEESAKQVTADGLVEGDAIKAVKLSADTSAVTDSGEIIVSDAVVNNADQKDVTGNYNITYKPGRLTVKKATGKITFADSYQTEKDYDTEPFALPTEEELDLTGASYDDVIFTWYEGSAKGTELTGAPTDAGTYVLVVSIPETESTTAASAEKEVKINKITISEDDQFTFPDWPEEGYVYDGTAKEPTVTVWIDKDRTVQLPQEEYTVEYVNNVDAGNGAQVIVKNAEDSKNCEIDYMKLFSITPAPVSIDLRIPETAVYGEDISLTAVLAGVSETDVPTGSVTFTIGNSSYNAALVNGTASLPAEQLTGISAGDHGVTVSYPGQGNYAKAEAEGTLAIQKANPDVGTVSCANETLYTSNSWKDVELTKSGSAAGTLALDETTLTAGTNMYKWTFVPDDTANYYSTEGMIELTVQAVTVERIEVSGAPEKTAYIYGDTFDMSGLTVTVYYVNGDKKVLTDNEVEIRYDHGAFLWAGDTSVTVAYTEAGETYTAKVEGLTVSGRTVEEPEIRLAIPEGGYVYDGTEKEPGVTVYADGLLIPASEYTVTYRNNINAGKAEAVITDNEGGNFIVSGTAAFDIAKAAQRSFSIVGMPEGEITYGDVFPLETAGGSGEGAVTWEVTAGADFADIDEEGNVTVKGVGDVTITAVKAADDNYTETIAQWTFSTGKANPEVGEVTYAGGVIYSTDDPAEIILEKTGSVSGTLALAGDTVLSAGTAEYTWVFTPDDTDHYNEVSGKIELDITANRPVEIHILGNPEQTEYSYGDLFDPTGLMAEIRFENGLVRTVAVSELGIRYENGSFLIIGDESVTASYEHDGAEVSIEITGLTVTAKKVADPTIELEETTYVYDGTAKRPAVIVKDGDMVIPADEYTVTYADNVGVGTASVTITDNEGGNYEIAEKTVTFQIVEKQQAGNSESNGQNGAQTGKDGNKAVKTGDGAEVMIWLVIAAVSGMSVAAAYVWKKRRRV